jgi:hypothetical protein
MTAADLLGQTHPLTRATRRFETECLQLLSALAILAGVVVFAHGAARLPELVCAAVTAAALGGLVAGAWLSRRRRALEVILAGDEDLPLDELVPLRRKLHDRRHRELLAASFERYLLSAEEWHRTASPLRPVANVRLLLPLAEDVREVVRLLRVEAVPRVRGVALCGCLLTDGAGSPLYGADGEALRRELGRIRFSLDAT